MIAHHTIMKKNLFVKLQTTKIKCASTISASNVVSYQLCYVSVLKLIIVQD